MKIEEKAICKKCHYWTGKGFNFYRCNINKCPAILRGKHENRTK